MKIKYQNPDADICILFFRGVGSLLRGIVGLLGLFRFSRGFGGFLPELS